MKQYTPKNNIDEKFPSFDWTGCKNPSEVTMERFTTECCGCKAILSVGTADIINGYVRCPYCGSQTMVYKEESIQYSDNTLTDGKIVK